MSADDLTRPLGLPPDPATQPPRRGLSTRAMATGAACAAGIVAAVYVWMNDDGLGGRPRVVVPIQPLAVQQTAAAARPGSLDATPTATIPPGSDSPTSDPSNARRSGEEVERSSGVRVVRQGDDETPGALIIRVPDAPLIGLTPAPDRQLIEKGLHGPLPRIGPNGRKPMDVYSRPVATSSKLPANAPRIAIMIGGMGLSQNATRHALEKLPPAVTLAFAPYGSGLAGQVAGARDKGHEIILQAPMEAFDLASDGPGPHMLRTAQDRAELKNNLHWLMSRFPGYVGLANFLGAKFLADAKSVAALVEETGSRGLLLVDDGSSPQSLIAKIAAAADAPYILGDVVLDAERGAAGIEKSLLRLESLAREKGLAVGVATGLPDVVDRIATFAAGLERRGIALVPVSAAAVRVVRPSARIRITP